MNPWQIKTYIGINSVGNYFQFIFIGIYTKMLSNLCIAKNMSDGQEGTTIKVFLQNYKSHIFIFLSSFS